MKNRNKRLFDLFFSTLIIVLIFPLLFLIGLIVLIIDGKPIFFVHERIGLNFKKIRIYKFRTMKNSDKKDNNFDVGNSERVTKLGSFLRKYKLDELPQFFNVFKGDLSIVGPRPETEFWIKESISCWEEILQYRPGITDRASILFYDEESQLSKETNPEQHYKEVILPKKILIYKDYVKNNSFWGDILIILKTLQKIVLK